MGDNISYYFGAYLELEVSKIKTTTSFEYCENGHEVFDSFCHKCGGKNIGKKTVSEYPGGLYAFVEDDDLEERFTNITPEELFRTGKILLASNSGAGRWLEIGPYFDTPMSDFPDVTKLKSDFLKEHSQDIQELHEYDAVLGHELKAGYVFNAEY